MLNLQIRGIVTIFVVDFNYNMRLFMADIDFDILAMKIPQPEPECGSVLIAEPLLDDGLRRPVVVTLRKGLCLADFLAREVGPFRVSLLRNDVILVGLSAFVNA